MPFMTTAQYSDDLALSIAYSRAASSDRVDKVQRAVHAAAAQIGPQVFAAAAFARLMALSGRQRSARSSSKPPKAVSFAAPKAPAGMLEGYLATREKGREARLRLHAAAPSAISSDVMLMSFLRRTPAESLPAFLDLALARMAQAGERECCKSLLFLGADPNRPLPTEASFSRSARMAAYPDERAHPLWDIVHRACESYYEPQCLAEAQLYLAMGADPNGALSPYPKGVELGRSLRVRKKKTLSPMAQCFSTGGASLARALLEAGARSPHEPDLQGDVPALIAWQARNERARDALRAFASETERLDLLSHTDPGPESPAAPSGRAPRI